MSKSELDRFASAVRSDSALQAELRKVAVSDQAIVDFAKAKGYGIDLAEVSAYVSARKAELSLKDLDKVAGGKASSSSVTTSAYEVQTAVSTSTAAAEVEVVIVAT